MVYAAGTLSRGVQVGVTVGRAGGGRGIWREIGSVVARGGGAAVVLRLRALAARGGFCVFSLPGAILLSVLLTPQSVLFLIS